MNPYEYLYKEPIEEVECQVCEDVMPIDEAHEILDLTFVCDPDFYPACLSEWNNREYVRSDFNG